METRHYHQLLAAANARCKTLYAWLKTVIPSVTGEWFPEILISSLSLDLRTYGDKMHDNKLSHVGACDNKEHRFERCNYPSISLRHQVGRGKPVCYTNELGSRNKECPDTPVCEQ